MTFWDPVTIALFIVTCLAMILYGRKKKVHPNYPPGPPGLPLIGNMLMVNPEKPHLTFDELSKKYGPVYSIQLAAQKMIVICGYETVREAVVDHADDLVDKAHIPIFMEITEGNGIGFANGNNWKTMRRFTISTLRDFGMGKSLIEDKIIEECKSLVEEFKSYKGGPFENIRLMNASVANVIVAILLGHRFDYNDSKLQRLMTIINESFKLVNSPMVMLYNTFPSLVRWLPGSHRKVLANAEETKAFVRETFINQNSELDVNEPRNFIDAFLIKQKEVKSDPELYFHNENLTMLVTDLFMAGMETTSTTLRWGLLLIMKYPEIQKKVQDEIEKVIGGGEPHWIHRKQMPYTDAVIHEIQRFANIVPMTIPRVNTQDIHLKGFFIPKGSQVTLLLYSVLRDEKYFQKPEEFYPQHFQDSDGNFVKNEAFIPFFAGKRICAGENLAKMELFLFFTTLLQNFTFQAPPGAKLDLTADVGFTTAPMKHEICAIPRF